MPLLGAAVGRENGSSARVDAALSLMPPQLVSQLGAGEPACRNRGLLPYEHENQIL
jgi:hypothetical protein